MRITGARKPRVAHPMLDPPLGHAEDLRDLALRKPLLEPGALRERDHIRGSGAHAGGCSTGGWMSVRAGEGRAPRAS